MVSLKISIERKEQTVYLDESLAIANVQAKKSLYSILKREIQQVLQHLQSKVVPTKEKKFAGKDFITCDPN